jgi:hypothetical protein
MIEIELPDCASLASCEYLKTASLASVRSLCNNLCPGETLAAYQDGTLGTHNGHFIFGVRQLALNIHDMGTSMADVNAFCR